jgi:hypothetical protein
MADTPDSRDVHARGGVAVYPPTCWQDILDYDEAECFEGFTDFEKGEPDPGDNRSPSYRWGWRNAASDAGKVPDDFYAMRRQFIRETRALR